MIVTRLVNILFFQTSMHLNDVTTSIYLLLHLFPLGRLMNQLHIHLTSILFTPPRLIGNTRKVRMTRFKLFLLGTTQYHVFKHLPYHLSHVMLSTSASLHIEIQIQRRFIKHSHTRHLHRHDRNGKPLHNSPPNKPHHDLIRVLIQTFPWPIKTISFLGQGILSQARGRDMIDVPWVWDLIVLALMSASNVLVMVM